MVVTESNDEPRRSPRKRSPTKRYQDDDDDDSNSDDEAKMSPAKKRKPNKIKDATKSSPIKKAAPSPTQIKAEILLKIVKSQDCAKMQELLKDNPDMNVNMEIDDMGSTLLIKACDKAWANNMMKMIKLLIDHGADPNVEHGWFGTTALHNACACKHLGAIKLLLQHGADLRITNKDGQTPLYMACSKNYFDGPETDLKVVQYLVKNHQEADIHAQDNEDNTPMHSAIHDFEIVKFLMNQGADINAENRWGETPLFWALLKHDDDKMTSARAMIEHGANVNPPGCSLLHQACRFEHYRCDNYAEMITLLVESGANLQEGECDGYTPLLKACADHMAVSVRSLIENGANVHDKSKNGKTPLHHICDEYSSFSDYDYDEADDLPLAELLIRHGADCNSKDKNGDTPLHLTSDEKLGILELLIRNGADINAQNNDGKTRLYLACEQGQLEVVQLLANRPGTNVNTTTKDGVTPLQIASENGHLEIVWFLLKKYPWLVISEHSE